MYFSTLWSSLKEFSTETQGILYVMRSNSNAFIRLSLSKQIQNNSRKKLETIKIIQKITEFFCCSWIKIVFKSANNA